AVAPHPQAPLEVLSIHEEVLRQRSGLLHRLAPCEQGSPPGPANRRRTVVGPVWAEEETPPPPGREALVQAESLEQGPPHARERLRAVLGCPVGIHEPGCRQAGPRLLVEQRGQAVECAGRDARVRVQQQPITAPRLAPRLVI